MSYDRRKMAGSLDAKVAKAVSAAKSHWGSGWPNLTKDMQNAYICQALVGILGGMDWDHMLDRDPKEIVQKFKDITDACTKAIRS